MNYIFNFTFSFDDPDGETTQVGMSFLLDEAATARTGYTATSSDGDPPNPFADWFTDTADELEEEFSAVHDYFGTTGDQILVASFCTYEIDTIERARELMQRWRDAFTGFLGEQGVGPVVEIPDQSVRAIDQAVDYASALKDMVVQLSNPTANPPRP